MGHTETPAQLVNQVHKVLVASQAPQVFLEPRDTEVSLVIPVRMAMLVKMVNQVHKVLKVIKVLLVLLVHLVNKVHADTQENLVMLVQEVLMVYQVHLLIQGYQGNQVDQLHPLGRVDQIYRAYHQNLLDQHHQVLLGVRVDLVDQVDQQYQEDLDHLEHLVDLVHHFYQHRHPYRDYQRNLCVPWLREYLGSLGSHEHLVDLVDQLDRGFRVDREHHLCRLCLELRLYLVVLVDRLDQCHLVDRVDHRNLVDLAYQLDRVDLLDPFVPVGRQWLELDPLDLLPSCLRQLDRVDLVGQGDRAYLGYHLCLVDLLDRLVRRCLVDPADLRFLVHMLPHKGIIVSSNP